MLKGTTRNSYCIRGVGGGGTGGGKGRMERGIEGGRLTTLTVQFAALPLRNGTQGVKSIRKNRGKGRRGARSLIVLLSGSIVEHICQYREGNGEHLPLRKNVAKLSPARTANRLIGCTWPQVHFFLLLLAPTAKKGGSAAAAFLNLPVHLAASAQVGQHRA